MRVPTQKLALDGNECQTGPARTHAAGCHTARVDVDVFRWLLTEPGQALLARAEEAALSGEAELAVNARLRRDAEPDQVSSALSIAELRRRAAAKFGADAARMYFTTESLEQATRASVAAHRAARLQAAATQSVVDLGCGIGGDLVAFARAGITTAGVDTDPLRVEMARANLAALDLGGAVMVADATSVDTSPFGVAFADPARRTGRGRTFRVDDWSPSWEFVETLLERSACVKVAPGIPHSLVPEGVEAEWVSDHGEVKEAALWSGRLASVRRRATVIGGSGLVTITDEDETSDEVLAPGQCLYEPDGAVIRAGLVTAVAAGVKGGLVDPRIAYVTSDEAFRTPFAKSYAVLEELPFREKALKAALRERNVGRLTIKKRGVGIEPAQLRQRLDLQGDDEATVVLTRAAGRGICLLVRPF